MICREANLSEFSLCVGDQRATAIVKYLHKGLKEKVFTDTDKKVIKESHILLDLEHLIRYVLNDPISSY